MNKISKAVCLFIILLVLLSGCTEDVPEGSKAVKLYFANSARDTLVSETHYIDKSLFNDTQTLVEAVMKKLLEGPMDSKHSSVIPKNVTLRGVSVSKTSSGTVNIDLGGEYYRDSTQANAASDELLARYSIICTLCQFDGVQKVKLFVNGEHMKSKGGKGDIIAPMGSESIHMNSPSSVDTQTEKFVTLYFTDKDGEKLYPETRKATMTDNSIEKTIVSELMRGPVSERYARTIPDGVGIISIETTEEVCFVNLTSEFTAKLVSGSKEEKIAVYSIVNSLTYIAGIEKVQILIDGKKPENDVRQLFSTPLERNQNMIVETNIQ
ncbi:MAG: GerMN domain-containing protein [Clostridia bacterium]|nr:GerMN domain-containing protein [Clostridia bacterium]